jgi:DNA-binding MarR family transcriptional regulator
MAARNQGRSKRLPASSARKAGPDPFHLVRFTHIFSSAVREILESSLLRETTDISLTLPQFHLLKLMSINGKHQAGEVAQFLGVSAPAASKNIDKLEGLGLVLRSPLKGDRRATLLSVSPKGRKLVGRYEELKSMRLAPILENFTPEEISQFTALLRRFAISLYESDKPGNGACLRCSAYIEAGCPVSELRGGCPYQDVRSVRAAAAEDRETP